MISKRNIMPAVFIALLLLTSGLCNAQGVLGIEVAEAKASAESVVPGIDSSAEEKPITLEELKSIFGAKICVGLLVATGPL